MLHRSAGERAANALEQRFARGAVVAEHAHLDELVRAKREIDLVQDRRRKSMLADAHDRMQPMGTRAKRATSSRVEGSWHG
jgi:hypothetical protein